MKNIMNNIQKYTLMALLINLLVAQVGRAQVVLPSSSEYNNPENYFHDCINNNGEENSGICEQQTNLIFKEDSEEKVAVQEDYASAQPAVIESIELNSAE